MSFKAIHELVFLSFRLEMCSTCWTRWAATRGTWGRTHELDRLESFLVILLMLLFHCHSNCLCALCMIQSLFLYRWIIIAFVYMCSTSIIYYCMSYWNCFAEIVAIADQITNEMLQSTICQSWRRACVEEKTFKKMYREKW